MRQKSFRHADLYIGQHYVSATTLTGEAVQNLSALGLEPSRAYLDVRSGRWGTLMPAHPLLPGTGVGNHLRWDDKALAPPSSLVEHEQRALQAFTGYIQERADLLGIDAAELRGQATAYHGGDLVQIHAPRYVDGIPVRDSFAKGVINHGNLVLFGVRNWDELGISTTPTLTQQQAVGVISSHLGSLANDARWPKSSLEILPMARGFDPRTIAVGTGIGYRLAWVLRPDFQNDQLGTWEALVDAHSGELLAFEDQTKYASHDHAHDKGALSTREIDGGVFPVSNDGLPPDGVEVTYPMPFADVENNGTTLFSDTGGNVLACLDGDITTTLSGPFLTMIDTCGEISETSSGATLDLGTSGGTDCVVPPGASDGNTHASRSGFYELNRSIEWGRSHLPDNPWLRQQLPATMNINANCNASGGAGGVNFFTSGGGCANTGELAAVFVHEWGHGMDASDATPGFANPPEGIADVYAALRLGTSCIGRNFRLGVNCTGFGDPCLSCDGVRDIDWANRASGMPHGISGPLGIDALCGTGSGGPCGGIIHCEGAVFAEAVWDLWKRDLSSPPFSYSDDKALEVTTRLNFIGSGGVSSFYNCADGTGMGDGCNAGGGYLNFLAADDDDGDLGNGTPHMSAIFAAYDRHEIACPTPAVIDSGCGVLPSDPVVVSTTDLDRGVELSWGAVANADSYRIYRTEGVNGCNFGKILIGETTGTTFVDSGLRNGREYFYLVFAMGDGDTCFGSDSGCFSYTPSGGANLAVDPVSSGAVTILTGDGDAFLDNCEVAEVRLGVINIGTGGLTNVRILDARPVDHPEMIVLSSLPLALGDLAPACDVATAELEIYADGLDLGDSVSIEVDVTSNELFPDTRTAIVRLAIPGTESDLQGFASKTFDFETDFEDWQVAEGTFTRTGTGGGDGTTFFADSSDGLNNNCDRIRSPIVVLSSKSTMTMWNNYDIEPLSGGTWYDRANIGIIDGSGNRSLVTPDGGRLYNANSSGPGNYSGCNDPEEGWADTQDTWATSSWTAGALQSSIFDGQFVQLEVIYGTDPALAQRGFWFDEVTLTDIGLQVDDQQSNACAGTNQPPAVEITEVSQSTFNSAEPTTLPLGCFKIDCGTSIVLSGSAYDTEDGDLSGMLTWSSDRQGFLGSGAMITVSLTVPGIHIITATVSDSSGFLRSASILGEVNLPCEDASDDLRALGSTEYQGQQDGDLSLDFVVSTSAIGKGTPIGSIVWGVLVRCLVCPGPFLVGSGFEDVVVDTTGIPMSATTSGCTEDPLGVPMMCTLDEVTADQPAAYCIDGMADQVETSEQCARIFSSGSTDTNPVNDEDCVTLLGTVLLPLFADGFESGDASSWSDANPLLP